MSFESFELEQEDLTLAQTAKINTIIVLSKQ
jgi:hypothetical protein